MTANRPIRPAMPPTIPGRCDTGNPICGADARLYAAGWRCLRHQPTSRPDTDTTRKDNP